MTPDLEQPLLTSRTLAEGTGWRVTDVTCRAGPSHRSSQEQFGWATVAVVLAGSFTYRCTAGTAVMVPTALLLGESGACFECGHHHGTGDRCLSFQFAPDYVDELLCSLERTGPRPSFTHTHIPPLASTLPLLSRLRALIRTPVSGVGEQIALDILTQAYGLDLATAEAPASRSDEQRVSDAVRMMEACYADRMSLASLAAQAGIGRRRFATIFRRVTGLAPYQYIINLRLNAAAEQLEQGAPSVLAVALDVGFGDLSEFTRAFQRRFGAPPASYRRSIRARLG